MNPDDKFQELNKKLRTQSFEPLNLDPLFKDLIKKASASHNLFNLSVPFPSMQTLFGANSNLLPLLNTTTLHTGSLQSLFGDINRTAEIYKNLSSLTNPLTKMFGDADFSKRLNSILFPTFEFPKSPFQSIIDAGKKYGELHRIFDPTSGFRVEIEKLAQLQKGLHVTGLPNGMASFASRVFKEAEFRQAFLDRFESESSQVVKLTKSEINIEETLQTIELGIAESGVAQASNDVQTSLNTFFAWFNKLNPALRELIIAIIAGVLLMVADHAIYDKKEKASPTNIKIVQKITNNIFVEAGVPIEARKQFRIVAKNGLPVFRSNRRDSERIGTLDATQVVVITAKKRNWTQVEWRDPNTEEMRSGWVFTRYLKKI